MKCLSCLFELKELNYNSITLDVCEDGCGGIWFEAGELDKFDFENEVVSDQILFSGKNQNNSVVNSTEDRQCPKCNLSLTKNCFYKEFHIEIDSCSKCGGVWLDPGELKVLREDNSLRELRENVIEDFKKQISNTKSPERIRAVVELIFK
jgi:Zn-finger nucleic acid-binding protein